MITPRQNPFDILFRRVDWLNDKIAWAMVNGKKAGLYEAEREALLWLMDECRRMAARLVGVSLPATPEEENEVAKKALVLRVRKLEEENRKLRRRLGGQVREEALAQRKRKGSPS